MIIFCAFCDTFMQNLKVSSLARQRLRTDCSLRCVRSRGCPCMRQVNAASLTAIIALVAVFQLIFLRVLFLVSNW